MKQRNQFFLILLMAISGRATAQTIPLVGMNFFDDALRRGQLLGQVTPDLSFMVRPVHASRSLGIDNVFGYDSLLFPRDTNRYSTLCHYRNDKWKTRVILLPVSIRTRTNGHHPYGWADGPMVPSKGFQTYLSGGVFAKCGPLEMQFRPEFVSARNKPFQNPPFRPRSIDMPERMGQTPYQKSFPGQSYAKVIVGPIAAGYSTENIWWGAGLKNGIIMSNNAPGFGHFTVNSIRPVKTPFGSFEGQMVGGKLRHSGFTYPLRYEPGTWPPIAGDVVADTSTPAFHTFFNGTTGVFQPKAFPGLSLAATRIVQVDGEPYSPADYFRVLYLSSRGEQRGSGGDSNAINRNQIVSISLRYLLPESHAELYAEVGREDWAWDLEDLITRPRATTAWMGGFRKIEPLPQPGSFLQFMCELTHIQQPMDSYSQPTVGGYYSFYMHGNGVGWTNQGQVLGAGIGPGSNMFTIGLSQFDDFTSTGIEFERVVYNEDMFWRGIDYLYLGAPNQLLVDFSKHFVDWGFIVTHHRSYGKFFVEYKLHAMKTYNFQWQYDPDGKPGDFRFPGINVWSLNTEVSAVYRF